MDKEPGQEFCETYAQAFADESGTLAPCDLWERLSDSQKSAWARIEHRMWPSLGEVATLRAKAAELENALATNEIERQEQIRERKRAEARVRAWETATGEEKPRIVKARLEERDAIVAKLGEAIDIAYNRRPKPTASATSVAAQMAAMEALKAYHASLTQELPPNTTQCASVHATGLRCASVGPHEKHEGQYVWLEPRGNLFDIDGNVELWCPDTPISERAEPSDPAWSDGQFAHRVDLALQDVPLDAGERAEAVNNTGIDPTRLALRLRARVGGAAQGLPPELPAPGRDRDAPRRPTVDRMDAAPARDERDHVHEVGSCSFCDRALRQGATPCLTWQEPEYGGRCRACGGSKEEHEGRARWISTNLGTKHQ